MAYVSSDLRLPAEAKLLHKVSAAFASFGGSIAISLRRRWIYHRTLAELQGYSDRNLRDLGANHGIEEFARRCAGV
jgi:uncharacterized protein YjiS (DUF1127 family)